MFKWPSFVELLKLQISESDVGGDMRDLSTYTNICAIWSGTNRDLSTEFARPLSQKRKFTIHFGSYLPKSDQDPTEVSRAFIAWRCLMLLDVPPVPSLRVAADFKSASALVCITLASLLICCSSSITLLEPSARPCQVITMCFQMFSVIQLKLPHSFGN